MLLVPEKRELARAVYRLSHSLSSYLENLSFNVLFKEVHDLGQDGLGLEAAKFHCEGSRLNFHEISQIVDQVKEEVT